MPFSVVAHLRHGPTSWGPYASRDEADRKVYALWGEKLRSASRSTPWEIVWDAGPGTFTVWEREAGRSWRIVETERNHGEALEIARRSSHRALILPDGAPAPPRCDPTKALLPAGLYGQRVTVALNFHNGCYTVEAGEVRGYTPAVWLRDVTTRVRPGGYASCQRDQSRNVHAWLLGEFVDAGKAVAGTAAPEDWRRITYRCKDGPPCFFFTDDGACLDSASEVLALPDGVWVAPAAYEIVVQGRRGPQRWFPYLSRAAAEDALPALKRLRVPGVIASTWQVLPLRGGAGP